jgi:hypothetical protein
MNYTDKEIESIKMKARYKGRMEGLITALLIHVGIAFLILTLGK